VGPPAPSCIQSRTRPAGINRFANQHHQQAYDSSGELTSSLASLLSRGEPAPHESRPRLEASQRLSLALPINQQRSWIPPKTPRRTNASGASLDPRHPDEPSSMFAESTKLVNSTSLLYSLRNSPDCLTMSRHQNH
jgi:hypothetical protein